MARRNRVLRTWLAVVMLVTLAMPAAGPAPALAADADFVGGPVLGSASTVIPNDHTPFAVRFTGSGLDADSTYYVKARFTLTPSPSGGGANNRGFIWNKDTGKWVINRGAQWNEYPTIQTDASGNVKSGGDANWIFVKFGNENNHGTYYLNISLNKGGDEGATRNSDSPLEVRVLDMVTEGAWVHNGTATGAQSFKRVSLNSAETTSSTDKVLMIHRTEANEIDDDSNGIVDDEDWGPEGAIGDYRFAAQTGTEFAIYIQQARQAGTWTMNTPHVDIALGAEEEIPPSQPANLHVTAAPTSASLEWDAATDNVGVVAYNVYRQEHVSNVEFTGPRVRVATVTETSFEDTGLEPLKMYTYEVRAVDAATNVGPSSSRATVVTPAPPVVTIQHDAAGVTFDRFVSGHNASYSGGGYVYGRWAGTRLQARFSGTLVRWIGPKQPNYGKADVYIDGIKQDTVDCYADAAAATLETVLWESDAIADGPHTLEIRLVGEKNPASTASIVVIDRFEAEGTSAAGGGQRHDEMTGALSGPWIKGSNSTYYDKGYHYSRYTNASFKASFTGTKVAWIGPKTGSYGRARVFIDGVQQGTVVSQRGTMGWRERVWESKTLTPGSHTIEIRPTATKDASSRGLNIVIDALDVTP